MNENLSNRDWTVCRVLCGQGFQLCAARVGAVSCDWCLDTSLLLHSDLLPSPFFFWQSGGPNPTWSTQLWPSCTGFRFSCLHVAVKVVRLESDDISRASHPISQKQGCHHEQRCCHFEEECVRYSCGVSGTPPRWIAAIGYSGSKVLAAPTPWPLPLPLC